MIRNCNIVIQKKESAEHNSEIKKPAKQIQKAAQRKYSSGKYKTTTLSVNNTARRVLIKGQSVEAKRCRDPAGKQRLSGQG
jgi:hypothetical protein